VKREDVKHEEVNHEPPPVLEYAGAKTPPPTPLPAIDRAAAETPSSPSDRVPWWLCATVAAIFAAILFYLFVRPAYELRQMEREKNNRRGIYPV
jgi:hypothetical protein